jgi:hypothetical protein
MEGWMIGNSALRAPVFIFLLTQAQAATLELQGTASVDKGSGFDIAFHNMHVDGGDRVRALKGCVNIVYDNGYRTNVCNGRLAVVFSTPPGFVANGSLKDTPAAVAAPETRGAYLLPAALLFSTGIETAVGVTAVEDNDRPAGP